MKVSITLPSIFPEALNRALADNRATTIGDFEAIVALSIRSSRRG